MLCNLTEFDLNLLLKIEFQILYCEIPLVGLLGLYSNGQISNLETWCFLTTPFLISETSS